MHTIFIFLLILILIAVLVLCIKVIGDVFLWCLSGSKSHISTWYLTPTERDRYRILKKIKRIAHDRMPEVHPNINWESMTYAIAWSMRCRNQYAVAEVCTMISNEQILQSVIHGDKHFSYGDYLDLRDLYATCINQEIAPASSVQQDNVSKPDKQELVELLRDKLGDPRYADNPKVIASLQCLINCGWLQNDCLPIYEGSHPDKQHFAVVAKVVGDYAGVREYAKVFQPLFFPGQKDNNWMRSSLSMFIKRTKKAPNGDPFYGYDIAYKTERPYFTYEQTVAAVKGMIGWTVAVPNDMLTDWAN